MKGKKNQGRCTLPMNLESIRHVVTRQTFTVQGLWDALTEAESAVTELPTPMDEFHHSIGSDYGRLTWEAATTSLLMEWRHGVTCAERRSSFEDLEHVQVDGPGLTYLFFYDQHGYHGLSKEEALTMCSHIADAFA